MSHSIDSKSRWSFGEGRGMVLLELPLMDSFCISVPVRSLTGTSAGESNGSDDGLGARARRR